MTTSRRVIDLRTGQKLMLSGSPELAKVELLEKSGKYARLLVTAPRETKIEVVGKADTSMTP